MTGHPARLRSARDSVPEPREETSGIRSTAADQSGITPECDVAIPHAGYGERTTAGRTQSLNGSILMKDADATISLVTAFQ